MTPSSKLPHTDMSICTDQQFPTGQHKKKKSKKHKDKERERLKPEWIETSPDLKKSQENLKGKWPYKCTSTVLVCAGALP